MQVLDASSIIHGWDNYPILQFPGLWEWISEQIEQKTLVMPTVAFGEVNAKTPECALWLKEAGISLLDPDNTILEEAIRIKSLVGIVNDNYHPNGVGENDLITIATTRLCGGELVSDEGRQASIPTNPTKRKIPAVCRMDGVKVPCISFIELLKRSQRIFR